MERVTNAHKVDCAYPVQIKELIEEIFKAVVVLFDNVDVCNDLFGEEIMQLLHGDLAIPAEEHFENV